MKKFIIISLIILVVLLSAGIVYLNNVFLPKTIKALIVKSIQEQTHSKVTLGSIRVNIFKGLVLTNLEIYGQQTSLIKVKEVSCLVFPFPILRKQLIIPLINIKSAQIYLERRNDNTFNLADLFLTKPAAANNQGAAPSKTANGSSDNGFAVSVYRVNLSNCRVLFKDSSLSKPLVKTLENLNAAVYLSLPASVKFKASAFIQGAKPVKIGSQGEFKIPSQELSAKLNILGFSPVEFSAYYEGSGIKISESSSFDISGDLKTKNNALYADIQAQGKNLNILRDKISVFFSIDSRIVLEYGLSDKNLKYSGSSKIYDANISGLDFIDKISAIDCGVIFNNSGLSTDNLTGQVLGLPVKAKAALTDFSDPSIKLNMVSGLSLTTLQSILKDEFKFNLPGSISGQGDLLLSVEGKLSDPQNLTVKGGLDLMNGSLKLEKIDSPIQEINGRIVFVKDKLKWEDLSLKYQNVLYKTTGSLANFKSPFLDVALNSSDLSLTATLTFNNKLVKVYKCFGNYLSSQFLVSGDIDISDSASPKAGLTGELLIDLKDLNKYFPKLKEQLNIIKPEGKIKASFDFSGKVNEIKTCSIEAKLSSGHISLYGLNMSDFSLDYSQAEGVADIRSMRLTLYSGSLEAAFRADLNSQDYPYLLDASLQNVKIEELKLDTLAKSKDISGVIQAALKIKGSLIDLPGSNGTGMFSISKGKLWELDLFKGMGKLLFSQEFTNITFSDGKCDFVIKDKFISTENLLLEGNIVNLSGPVRIGLDNSISASLNVDIISEMVPLTGTYKDVATALIGEADKFAVIKISGTLKDPKYKFQTAVTNIIQSLAGNLLKRL